MARRWTRGVTIKSLIPPEDSAAKAVHFWCTKSKSCQLGKLNNRRAVLCHCTPSFHPCRLVDVESLVRVMPIQRARTHTTVGCPSFRGRVDRSVLSTVFTRSRSLPMGSLEVLFLAPPSPSIAATAATSRVSGRDQSFYRPIAPLPSYGVVNQSKKLSESDVDGVEAPWWKYS